jgi:OCT family organic cation transporter-like MFS transporter 4/5
MSTVAAPNYWVYLTIRTLTGISTGGVGLTSFVLATEPIGPSRRGQAGMSAFYFFSFGIMAVPVFASWTTSWRALYIQASLPAVVYCLLVLPFVFESPRWYLVHGRLEEAMLVLRSFATLNGKFVPEWVGLRTDFITIANQAGDDNNTLHPLLLHEVTAPIADEKVTIHGNDNQLLLFIMLCIFLFSFMNPILYKVVCELVAKERVEIMSFRCTFVKSRS